MASFYCFFSINLMVKFRRKYEYAYNSYLSGQESVYYYVRLLRVGCFMDGIKSINNIKQSSPMSDEILPTNGEPMLEYEMGAVIHGEGAVTNLDFHREGKWLVMSTNESSIHFIDTFTGEEKKKLFAKADGTGNVKFTHHESCVLFSSERNNSDIKYLCAYDNRYLRYFKGHTDKVTSISMNPCDDCFLSSSLDKSICLWNLSMPNPIAKLQLPGRFDCPYATFDASGMVFGVLCQDMYTRNHQLKLFDARQFDAGPFQEILPEQSLLENAIRTASPEWTPAQISKSLDCTWNQFEFSPDGNHILVNTQSDLLLVLDGFRSDIEPLAITTRKNDTSMKLGSCMTPTAKYVVTASDDNEILLYDFKNEENGKMKTKLCGLLTGHVSPVGCIACNPKYDVMATSCVNTVLWIPKVIV